MCFQSGRRLCALIGPVRRWKAPESTYKGNPWILRYKWSKKRHLSTKVQQEFQYETLDIRPGWCGLMISTINILYMNINCFWELTWFFWKWVVRSKKLETPLCVQTFGAERPQPWERQGDTNIEGLCLCNSQILFDIPWSLWLKIFCIHEIPFHHSPTSVSPKFKLKTQNLDVQTTCTLGCYVCGTLCVSFYAIFDSSHICV